MLKNNKYNILWILLATTMFGVILRLIGFGVLPAGLNRDEAALGYNAFSLLQSGKDEWGASWPVVFRSFGDYKLAGYIYVLIPFIQLFGNTALAVRAPSLLAGIVLIPLAYALTKEIFQRKDIALVFAGIQAISPWAIHYSKIGFEANLALMLFVASVCLFVKRNATQYHHVLGLALLFFSLLTYNAPLVLIPCIFFIILLMKKHMLSGGIFIVSVCAFLLVFPATKGKTGITVFTDVGVVEQQHVEYQKAGNNIIYKTLAHPIVFYPKIIILQYIKSYDPLFLVYKGGSNPWHQAPNSGHITLGIFILFLLGICSAGFLFKKQSILLYVFLLIAPLASAITVDAPQATRMLFFFFMMSAFASIGFHTIWKYSKSIAMLAGIILLIESVYFQYNALQSFSSKPQTEWYSGMGEALQKAELYRKNDETIGVVGDVHYMYIYPAFYTPVSPDKFRNTIEYFPNDAIGLSQVKKVGHYAFASHKDNLNQTALIIEQRDGKIHIDSTSFAVLNTSEQGRRELQGDDGDDL